MPHQDERRSALPLSPEERQSPRTRFTATDVSTAMQPLQWCDRQRLLRRREMILVVGASGQLGGTITRRLLDQGRSVSILVRHNPAYQTLVALGAQPVVGDVKD